MLVVIFSAVDQTSELIFCAVLVLNEHKILQHLKQVYNPWTHSKLKICGRLIGQELQNSLKIYNLIKAMIALLQYQWMRELRCIK